MQDTFLPDLTEPVTRELITSGTIKGQSAEQLYYYWYRDLNNNNNNNARPNNNNNNNNNNAF